MSGEAFKMRIETARLAQRLQLAPAPFAPPPLLPPVDYTEIVEGYASPATIDREFAKFAADCWLPFKPDIPLLFRHGRPAGVILEVKSTDQGLYVRALVSDTEAKRCSFFSVAATIHEYQLRDVDDRERAHALVTCATLDEVSLTPEPCNIEAKIAHRYQQPAVLQMYDTLIKWAACMGEIFEVMQVIISAKAAQANAARASAASAHASATTDLVRVNPQPALVQHRPVSDFTKLVRQLNHRGEASA